MINRTLKTFAQHRAYIMRHGIVCFCRFFYIHILTFSLTHSTAGDIPRFPPRLPFTHRPQQNRLFACFSFSFFFFFQNPSTHKYWRAFSNPHWETWQYVIFYPLFFSSVSLFFFYVFLFSSSRTDYVHRDVIRHWKIQRNAYMEQKKR